MAPLTKSRGPKLSDGREGAASTRKKREKKIERVSLFQEAGQQNKQKNMGTIVAQPPEGYTFLTMGYPDLSAKCKDLSAQKGVSVKVVSAYNNSQEDNYRISHHLHRIGYHIRTDIFDEACDNLGYRFVDGKLTKAVTPNPILGFERPLARYEADLAQLGATSATDDESQRVRNAIKELFPNIPETSLNTILKTAWQKGATTIGHVAGLPLSRRVQLATVAHIRHTFTDYDELLRNHPWGEARRLVERTCLQKLVEWRGEDDTDNAAMASMLRETYSESSDDEDYSPAEWSEPDRYADNEDSSDGAYDMTRRPGGSLCLERTHPSFNPGSLAKLASAPAPKPVVSSTATQNISRTASSAMSQGANEGRRRTTEQAQNDSAAVSNYQHALAMTGQTINVPTDSRGRGPSSIFLEGKEYIRATPEDLASLRSEARTSNHQAFAIAPYSPFQYVPQSIHYAPQAVPPSPQYVLQPVGPFYPSPAAHPEHRPIQDLPPQRFFDLQGNEVLLDPASHHLNSTLTSDAHIHPQLSRTARDFSTHGHIALAPAAPPRTQLLQATTQSSWMSPLTILPEPRVRTVAPEAAKERIDALTRSSIPMTEVSRETTGRQADRNAYGSSSSQKDENEEYDPSNPFIATYRRHNTLGSSASHQQNLPVPTSTQHGAASFVQPSQRNSHGATNLDSRHIVTAPLFQHGAPALIQPVHGKTQHTQGDERFLREHDYRTT